MLRGTSGLTFLTGRAIDYVPNELALDSRPRQESSLRVAAGSVNVATCMAETRLPSVNMISKRQLGP